jgi:hypothetical protein
LREFGDQAIAQSMPSGDAEVGGRDNRRAPGDVLSVTIVGPPPGLAAMTIRSGGTVYSTAAFPFE